ncbi:MULTISPECIES: MoaD/ThiS family protein [unclassified Flavobacterium]|uniref:MoaD/ThiS family protein n=1 Tax=unclassified Flavobacterium TaxID=196869 RepID=UPI000EAF6ACE|nr:MULTISPECIES: MoaD/ThiS family protein [unclassified Flavobacterium]RKS01953.1 molybdopterin converting factor small subunit [Flavobacterium sp. 102]
MKIKCPVKYYGIISDIVDMDADIAEFNGDIPTLNDLRVTLEDAFPDMKEVNYLFAVNQTLVSDMALVLKNNDEIALLPAFSGG